jgi:hypothetical protein
MTWAQDSRRLAAEALLVEARELSKQRGKTAQQVIDKVQQAVPIWRELGEPFWTVQALFMIASAYQDLSQFGKAVEAYEKAQVVSRETNDRCH